MKPLVVEGLLAIAVGCVWLACLGFVRLRTALDRLHCSAFVNVAAGFCVALATVVQDGATSRSWKTAGLLFAMLLIGAATSHAVGRALYLRDSEDR